MPSKRTKFYVDAPIELLPLILHGEGKLFSKTPSGQFSIAKEQRLRHIAINSVVKLEDCLTNPKSHFSDLEPLLEDAFVNISMLISKSKERNFRRDRGASVSHKADRSTDVENLNPQQSVTTQSEVHHG